MKNDGSFIADALTEIGKRLADAELHQNNASYWKDVSDKAEERLEKIRQQWIKADKELFFAREELNNVKKQVNNDYVKRIETLAEQLKLANENRTSLANDLQKTIQQRDELDKRYTIACETVAELNKRLASKPTKRKK